MTIDDYTDVEDIRETHPQTSGAVSYFLGPANAKKPTPTPGFPTYRSGKNAGNVMRDLSRNDEEALALIEQAQKIGRYVRMYKVEGENAPVPIGKETIDLEKRREEIEDKLNYF